MGREYYCAYHSLLQDWEELSDQEVGRLFRACLAYSKTGTVEKLSGNERLLFSAERRKIDESRSAYEERCASNRKNAAKRTLANASDGKRSVAIDSDGKRTLANASEISQEEEKEEEEYIPPLTPPKGRGRKVFDDDSNAYRCARAMSEDICTRLGCKPHSEQTLQTWADDIDKCHRIDGRDWSEIGRVLEFSQADSFWQSNILSGANFRKKYLNLLGRAKERGVIDG